MITNANTAISLMKMALALLDAAVEQEAAVRLQHAINVAGREPIPQTIEEANTLLDALAAAGTYPPRN